MGTLDTTRGLLELSDNPPMTLGLLNVHLNLSSDVRMAVISVGAASRVGRVIKKVHSDYLRVGCGWIK